MAAGSVILMRGSIAEVCRARASASGGTTLASSVTFSTPSTNVASGSSPRSTRTLTSRRTEPKPVEAGGVPASLRPREEDRRPSSETIALHAYNLWLARGRPIGTDWDDWLEAERQLAALA